MRKRILLGLALAVGLFVYLGAVDADAAPIRPDIRKIVEQPQQDSTAEFIPARAGWDGSEMPRREPALNATLEAAGAGLTRADRAALLVAATPDPRAVLGILGLIFLLRLLRKQEPEAAAETQLGRQPAANIPGEEKLAA
ncbi:MAG: hypothetical protein ACR2IF_01475 [Terriglobales bacterium]